MVSTVEIAEILGVTRQAVNNLALRSGFPRPVGRRQRSRVWRRDQIEMWARSRSTVGRQESNLD